MERKPKEIVTFEFIKKPEELKDCWHLAFLGDLEGVKTKQDFVKNYFTGFLGKRLEKEETRDKQCIRAYFDNKGDLLEGKIYDAKGYTVLNINFDLPFFSQKGKPKERLKPPFIEDTGMAKILNVQEAFRNYIKPNGNLVISDNGTTMVFKKLALSPLDIYLRDPRYSLTPNILSKELLLYKYGYKLIEMVSIDIDGVIDSGRRREFNSDGLLIRQEFYTGTPWGGIVVDEINEWTYELNKRQVIMKNTNVYKGIVVRMSKYEVDENGGIIRHLDYHYDKRAPKSLFDDMPYDENYYLFREHQYRYDDNGRINEVITIDHSDFDSQARDTFAYDSQNRLVLQESYDNKNELESSTSCEYISATEVKIKSRFYPNSFVYQATQGG